MINKRFLKLVFAFVLAIGFVVPIYSLDCIVTYESHLEGFGWTAPVSDGQTSGVTGPTDRRLECIRIKLCPGLPGCCSRMGVEYQVKVKEKGWIPTDWASNYQEAGTTYEARPMYSIRIKLLNPCPGNSIIYRVYERVNEDKAWTPWKKDGEICGADNKQIEAIQIKVVKCCDFTLDYNNHFKVYNAKDPEFKEIMVTVQDQFDKRPRRAKLRYVEYFANPVSKNCEYIPYPHAHLTWYKMDQGLSQPTTWKVTLKNQFGEQKWLVGNPRYLLVPTEKIVPGTCYFPKFNHFKCYQVLEGYFKEREVTLTDQFTRMPIRFRVIKPLYFCNPVSKNEEGIYDKEYHLAVYSITPLEKEPIPCFIKIKNQFNKSDLFIGRSQMLCVPTKKGKFAEVK